MFRKCQEKFETNNGGIHNYPHYGQMIDGTKNSSNRITHTLNFKLIEVSLFNRKRCSN